MMSRRGRLIYGIMMRRRRVNRLVKLKRKKKKRKPLRAKYRKLKFWVKRQKR